MTKMLLTKKEKHELDLVFGGDGLISLTTLSNTLNNYKNLIENINLELGYNYNDIEFQVSPPVHGSFGIKLTPKGKDQLVSTSLNTVSGILVTLFTVYISNPKSKEDAKNQIVNHYNLTNEANDKLVNHTLNLHEDERNEQIINNTFNIVLNDSKVENLEIKTSDHKPAIKVDRSDFEALARKSIQHTKSEVSSEQIIKEHNTLIIKSIIFEGTAKWTFDLNGHTIKAKVKDEEFMNKLENKSFMKGDLLKVLLSHKKVLNEEFNIYEIDPNSYEILTVIKHISKNDPTQTKLNF